LIAPDHITSLASRTHAGGPVPFVLVGPGVRHNGLNAYNETEAARAGVLYPEGHTLAPAMIREKEIGFPRVP
jgi:2,3-bisphosphoglycerate-independent phosphoglycerate mutase